MSDTTTDTTAPTDATQTVDAYLTSLHEQDEATRTQLIERAWVPGGTYQDPLQEAAGHAQLGQIAGLVEQHYSGHRFRRTSAVDAHHDHVRFGWALVAPDGTPAVAGIDVGQLAPDGRLRSIVGFFGEPGPVS